MSARDMAILNRATEALATELPESWDAFFNAEPDDLPRRKAAFQRLYRAAADRWAAESLTPQAFTPGQRQGHVLLALLYTIPREQWDESDLHRLEAMLIPVEE